jgi:hypothetical protein
MNTLEYIAQGIRDGKFHDLAQLTPPDPALSQPLGGFGSDQQQDLTRT